MFQHFGQHHENPEIHLLLQHAIDINNKHLHTIEEMFNKKIPVPIRFTEKDVELTAPRLALNIGYTPKWTFSYHSFGTRVEISNPSPYF